MEMFSLSLCMLSEKVTCLLIFNLQYMYLHYTVFFITIMSIVMTETRFVYSQMLGPICMRLARKRCIWNSQKNLLSFIKCSRIITAIGM